MKLQKLKGKRIMSLQKPSRLRRKTPLRNLVTETRLSVDNLIRPIFVTHRNKILAIESMPGQFYFPLDEIEKTIMSTKKFKNKCTMFGINLGLELNQRLTNYAKINKVSKASVVKSLLVAYLNEKESK